MNELETFAATRPDVDPLSERELAALWSAIIGDATQTRRDLDADRAISLVSVTTRAGGRVPRRRFVSISLAAAAVVLGLVGAWGLLSRGLDAPAPVGADVDRPTVASSAPSAPSAPASTVLTAKPITGPPTTVPSVDPASLNENLQARLQQLAAGLTALGFSGQESSTDTGGVTTVWAFGSDQSRTITVTITPGIPLVPENHTRPPVTVVEQTTDRVRVAYDSNDGWQFTLTAERTGSSELPTVAEIRNLLYAIDP